MFSRPCAGGPCASGCRGCRRRGGHRARRGDQGHGSDGLRHFSLDDYVSMVSGQATEPDTQAVCPLYDNFAGTAGASGQLVSAVGPNAAPGSNGHRRRARRPGGGPVPVPATTPCTFTITFAAVSGTVPLRPAAFTILDELGASPVVSWDFDVEIDQSSRVLHFRDCQLLSFGGR